MNYQEMHMAEPGRAAAPPNMPADSNKLPDKEEIDTRFGRVTIFRKDPINFPHGLLGMPDRFQFCLTNFPSEKLARFRLLQSLDDLALSFITLPVDIDNPIIDVEDIRQGCKDLDIKEDNLAMLLIVSVHRTASAVRLSVNARAPLMLDATRRVATQYVFHNSKYRVQHFITT